MVARSAGPDGAAPQPAGGRPDGGGLRLRRRVRHPRPRGRPARPHGPDDGLAGVVAGRLRPLRSAVHPHGLAQRRHLPDQRRSRRRGLGHAAVRPAQQLAGQREPRQGAPAAVADQAEVRPQDLLGRPHDPRRQLRPGVDGVQDVRLRRRSRGRLGAGGHRLGHRAHLARRRALQRRPRARQPAGRRPDGPHLREPGGPQRQPERARRGQGHPRDVPPHGHERRGDRRPHRRAGTRSARPTAPRTPRNVGPEPEAAPLQEMGLGWKSSYRHRQAATTPSPAGWRAPGRPRR